MTTNTINRLDPHLSAISIALGHPSQGQHTEPQRAALRAAVAALAPDVTEVQLNALIRGLEQAEEIADDKRQEFCASKKWAMSKGANACVNAIRAAWTAALKTPAGAVPADRCPDAGEVTPEQALAMADQFISHPLSHSEISDVEEAGNALRAMAQRVIALSHENGLLREHAAGKITDGTLITGLHAGAGGFDLGLQGGAAQMLAEMLAQQFKDGGGINYLELSFTSSAAVPGEKFVVTIQKVGGLSPAQKLADVTAERDVARQLVDQYMAERDKLREQMTVPTIEPNSQQWGKLDGATAFQLIERHAGNWADTGRMMDEFAASRVSPSKRRMSAIENMGEAISSAVDEDPSGALSILTGAFVGLTVALLKQQGHVPTGEISIDGGKGRDITIHAKKEGSPA